MVNVGDIVKFGKYYQSSSKQKDAVEWIVLAQKEDSVLLLSKYILDAKPYNDELVDVTWETCSLRKWLNGDFLKEAFSESEIENILDSKIKNPSNWFPLRANIGGFKSNNEKFVSGGNNTIDKVFLLSWQEAIKYFPEHPDSDDKIRYAQAATIFFHPKDIKLIAKVLSGISAKGTAYAKENNLDQLEDCSTIWFRSPGNTQQMAVTNLLDDILYRPGCEVDDATNGVRPALWVKKEALLSREELKNLEEQQREVLLSSPTFLKLREAFELLRVNKYNDAKNIFEKIYRSDKNIFLANLGMACIENYYLTRVIFLEKIMNNYKKAHIDEKKIFNENIDFAISDNVSNDGASFLIDAVRSNNYKVVKFLLENGANPNFEEFQGRKATPLFYAAVEAAKGERASLEIGEILIDYGADVFAKTHDGFTIFGNKQNTYDCYYKLNPEFEQMVRKKYKEKIMEKWSKHPKEREILENKKTILLEEINKIRSEIKTNEIEINKLTQNIIEKQMDKTKLPFFAIKERRKINNEIKEMSDKKMILNFKNTASKKDCFSKINLNQSKIADIDATLNGELKILY